MATGDQTNFNTNFTSHDYYKVPMTSPKLLNQKRYLISCACTYACMAYITRQGQCAITDTILVFTFTMFDVIVQLEVRIEMLRSQL